MGWLELLGKDEEDGDMEGSDGTKTEETFEADKWEEVKV